MKKHLYQFLALSILIPAAHAATPSPAAISSAKAGQAAAKVAALNTAAANPDPSATNATLTAPSAEAADVPFFAPATQSLQQQWTGFYVGLNGGYGWGGNAINQSGSTVNSPTSVQNAMSNGAIPSRIANNPGGALIGMQFGYNYQFYKRAVLGLELSYDWASVTATETVNTAKPGFPAFQMFAEQKLGSLFAIKGRLGILPTQYPLLTYVTGGWVKSRVSTTATLNNPGCTYFCGHASSGNYNGGWVAGAGLEYNFTYNWTIRGEYLYYHLGNQYTRIQNPNFPLGYLAQTVSFNGNSFTLAANYNLW